MASSATPPNGDEYDPASAPNILQSPHCSSSSSFGNSDNTEYDPTSAPSLSPSGFDHSSPGINTVIQHSDNTIEAPLRATSQSPLSQASDNQEEEDEEEEEESNKESIPTPPSPLPRPQNEVSIPPATDSFQSQMTSFAHTSFHSDIRGPQSTPQSPQAEHQSTPQASHPVHQGAHQPLRTPTRAQAQIRRSQTPSPSRSPSLASNSRRSREQTEEIPEAERGLRMGGNREISEWRTHWTRWTYEDWLRTGLTRDEAHALRLADEARNGGEDSVREKYGV